MLIFTLFAYLDPAHSNAAFHSAGAAAGIVYPTHRSYIIKQTTLGTTQRTVKSAARDWLYCLNSRDSCSPYCLGSYNNYSILEQIAVSAPNNWRLSVSKYLSTDNYLCCLENTENVSDCPKLLKKHWWAETQRERDILLHIYIFVHNAQFLFRCDDISRLYFQCD